MFSSQNYICNFTSVITLFQKWDRTLCLKDSDGDGLSNGQELGDPDCVWEVGKEPARKTELSHPGRISTRILKNITHLVQCQVNKH
jgi:hypothetical protein